MTLSNLQCHSHIANIFKCYSSYSYAAVDKISTVIALARSRCNPSASCSVSFRLNVSKNPCTSASMELFLLSAFFVVHTVVHSEMQNLICALTLLVLLTVLLLSPYKQHGLNHSVLLILFRQHTLLRTIYCNQLHNIQPTLSSN